MPTLAICARFKRRGEFVHKCLHSDIGISNEEWESACRASFALRDTTGKNFFGEAIREKLDRAAAPVDSCELENATAANNALIQLLWEHIEFARLDSGGSNFTGGGESETLCFGILQLVNSCRERLKKVTEVAS